MKYVLTKNNIISNIKGSIVAVSISLVCILVFALLIRVFGISEVVIMPVNQIIKIGSIFGGTYMALKSTKENGLITGAIIGLVYTILAYLVFSILSANFTLKISNLYDLLFGVLVGAISGVLIVNIKK